MSYARVIHAGQQHFYSNVVRVWTSDRDTAGEYLSLELDAHPHLVHFWRPREGGRVSVLLASTSADMTAALQENARTAHWVHAGGA